jgi:enamine deaminase RidA (YjgF/YER057c/UK114 family)
MSVALMMAAAAQAASAGGTSNRQAIMPESAENRQFFEKYGFSEAVIDGDRVYLSGVVAGLQRGEIDPAAAYDRAFKVIADILKRSGSSWDSVLEMTTYHTDVTGQIDAFAAVKARYVRAPFPAWTAIDVDRLLPDNGLVEIKVVAKRAK